MRRWSCRLLLLALLAAAAASACKDEASRSRAEAQDTRPEVPADSTVAEDAAPSEADCDWSPVITPNGYHATYGCRFIHHCHKVISNGSKLDDEQIEICGADGTCLFRATHVCERWYLVNDGTRDILVNSLSGEVLTHVRLHGLGPTADAEAGPLPDGGQVEPVPVALVLPVTARAR